MTNHEYVVQALRDYRLGRDVGGDCFKLGICHYFIAHYRYAKPPGVSFGDAHGLFRKYMDRWITAWAHNGYLTPEMGSNITRRAVCDAMMFQIKANAR